MSELEQKIIRQKELVKRNNADFAKSEHDLALMETMHEIETIELYRGGIDKYRIDIIEETTENYVGDGRSSGGTVVNKKIVAYVEFGDTYFTLEQKTIIEQYIDLTSNVKNVKFVNKIGNTK